MRKKTFSLLSVLIGFWGFSQTIYFKYDEAGNQRYRGPDFNARQSNEIQTNPKSEPIVQNQSQVLDESAFWKQIRLYPVPVDDILTIDWNEDVDTLIESVSLYQHSTVHWKFQQQNLPSLNKMLKINMSGYEWGIYILKFTLKDGRIISRNITKR